MLLLLHVAYYMVCFMEGDIAIVPADVTSCIGLTAYTFSILMLYYVIFQIGHLWTVKLLVAPRPYHVINKSFLFRYVKHPNYYLNIIPELCGLALIFHSWYTLCIGLPVYLIPLIIRIRQEEQVMRTEFDNY
ncbi:hypothetical protein GCM10023149_25300 [Mucilaginibacter gynuensis]|uniref:Isoprenylcysteine carboxyl methyltransferase (ICMT) family protein n=2 Tax=Mucilaginibacter gynuensis TaxID=1302236 RepID=A0ABP8GGN4_9SPHI